MLGSSPLAVAAYEEAARRLNAYPDPRSDDLREAVAQKYGLEPERLIFGCGSDEIFTLVADAPGIPEGSSQTRSNRPDLGKGSTYTVTH